MKTNYFQSMFLLILLSFFTLLNHSCSSDNTFSSDDTLFADAQANSNFNSPYNHYNPDYNDERTFSNGVRISPEIFTRQHGTYAIFIPCLASFIGDIKVEIRGLKDVKVQFYEIATREFTTVNLNNISAYSSPREGDRMSFLSIIDQIANYPVYDFLLVGFSGYVDFKIDRRVTGLHRQLRRTFYSFSPFDNSFNPDNSDPQVRSRIKRRMQSLLTVNQSRRTKNAAILPSDFNQSSFYTAIAARNRFDNFFEPVGIKSAAKMTDIRTVFMKAYISSLKFRTKFDEWASIHGEKRITLHIDNRGSLSGGRIDLHDRHVGGEDSSNNFIKINPAQVGRKYFTGIDSTSSFTLARLVVHEIGHVILEEFDPFGDEVYLTGGPVVDFTNEVLSQMDEDSPYRSAYASPTEENKIKRARLLRHLRRDEV